jgi:tetratricopeptide (TPR) repeat protein
VSADDEKKASSDDHKPARVEDILLERLVNEPPVAPQVSPAILSAIILGIIGLGVGIYFLSVRPEKFLPNPHEAETSQPAQDTSEVHAKRVQYQPMVDSLNSILAADPTNIDARLMLGNTYYEMEYWPKAKKEYELYLDKHPENPDVRVDYAFVLAEATGDFHAALDEINTALKYDPNHLNALFKGGLIAIQVNLDNKKKAITEATSYFKRALVAAKKQGNDKMAEQIEQILAKLKEPADSKQ